MKILVVLVAGFALVTGEVLAENGTSSDVEFQNRLLERMTKLETMVATSLENQKSLANQITVLTALLTELTRKIPDLVPETPLDPCRTATKSGVYNITSLNSEVYCEAESFDGGWLVFQQRANLRLSFYRSWAEFRDGFGTVGNDSDFWVGLETVHRVTSSGNYELAVEMKDRRGTVGFAGYGVFRVAGENEKYRLTIGDYAGSAGDALRKLNNTKFSTKDSDNDNAQGNCASDFWTSGWWYNTCDVESAPNYNAINWPPFSSLLDPAVFIRMMIRRK